MLTCEPAGNGLRYMRFPADLQLIIILILKSFPACLLTAGRPFASWQANWPEAVGVFQPCFFE